MSSKERTTFEVFRMDRWGDPFVQVGSLHAEDPEIALLTAQELYGRREGCVSIWVVRHSDIYATPAEAVEEFQIAKGKTYRLANFGRERHGRNNRDKIEHTVADLETETG